MQIRHSLGRGLRKHPRLGALALQSGTVALVLALAGAVPIAAAAQQQARLTVRPREMATGTRTERAGDYQLDSLPPKQYWAYAPPSCVGTTRCPLVVYLLPGDYSEGIRVAANDHGTLMLFVNMWPTPTPSPDPQESVNVAGMQEGVDIALQQILRRFAVDPDRIAIIGNCATATQGVRLGASNPDVFNRVAIIAGPFVGENDVNTMDPRDTTTEWFQDQGIPEFGGSAFTGARALRRAGRPVKSMVSFRQHSSQWETYDFLWQWFLTSWAIRNPAARPAPRVVVDPPPLLTVEAVRQMAAFWARFMEEPDSILTTGRRAHLREVVVPVGTERLSLLMTDMPALAAAYPSVATALKTAGLTPQDHDAYRIALASARVASLDTVNVQGLSPSETKNRAFLEQHPDELEPLEEPALLSRGVWMTP